MNSCISGTSVTLRPSVLGQCREQCHQDNICIILLIGIPGSGKSYFRMFLENYFKENSKTVMGTLKVFSVSYDNFCQVRNPTHFSDSVVWKEERLEIFRAVENIIKSLKTGEPKLSNIPLDSICVINSEISNPNTVLFIIDDNMYYRSMRYEYYKLSRSYNMSFCQIFFNASLQDALKCNRQREPKSQVPENVIEKMFEKLEPPDKNLAWEENTIALMPYIDIEKNGVLGNILYMIETALKCPVQLNLEGLYREEARYITNSNAIHQIDIVLKKLVGDLIKKKIKENSDNPCKISQYFSERRLGLLKKIKEGKILFPVNLNGPVSKQDIELVQPILSDLLDSSI